MSFEGYYRTLCQNGHLNEFDVYDYSYEMLPSEKYNPLEQMTFKLCIYCQSEIVWWEIVDQTNDNGNPTKLEKIENKINTYKIPKRKER